MADTLSRRYLYKLGTNGLSTLAMLCVEALVSRSLGPRGYGSFQFLNGFFQQVISFCDLGASTALATKAAQRPDDTAFVRYYWAFVVAIGVVLALTTVSIEWLGFAPQLWPGQEMPIVWLAFGLALVTHMATAAGKLADAYGCTVASERSRAMQRLGLVVVVAVVYSLERLGLAEYFAVMLLAAVIMLWLQNRVLRRAGQTLFGTAIESKERRQAISSEYFNYSHPLAAHAAVGLLAGLADLWLLQHFGGSTEQGYYGLALRISAAGLVFTTAMTPLLMRDLAVAGADLSVLAARYVRHVPLLSAVATSLSCFLAVTADRIVVLVGGAGYAGGAQAMAIMAFYPILQTLVQLGATVFLATGRTVVHRNLGLASSIVGLPLTYVALAPPTLLGLAAGATGLAVKVVVVGLLGVGVQTILLARLLGVSMQPLVRRQLIVIALFVTLALAARAAASLLVPDKTNDGFWFAAVAAVYGISMFCVTTLTPEMVGLTREDLRRLRDVSRRSCLLR